jgi:hypothetical protein
MTRRSQRAFARLDNRSLALADPRAKGRYDLAVSGGKVRLLIDRLDETLFPSPRRTKPFAGTYQGQGRGRTTRPSGKW